MTNNSERSVEAVHRLLDAQEISPTLRRSYENELDKMLHPELTMRSAAPGGALLLILLACIAGLVHSLLTYDRGPLVTTKWLVIAVGLSGAAYLIARDLWLKKHTPRATLSVAQILTGVAGSVTAVAMLQGMSNPDNPASTFNVIFPLVFYVACLAWAIERRIVAAELAAREQMLRIEYRLADLAERRPSGPQAL